MITVIHRGLHRPKEHCYETIAKWVDAIGRERYRELWVDENNPDRDKVEERWISDCEKLQMGSSF